MTLMRQNGGQEQLDVTKEEMSDWLQWRAAETRYNRNGLCEKEGVGQLWKGLCLLLDKEGEIGRVRPMRRKGKGKGKKKTILEILSYKIHLYFFFFVNNFNFFFSKFF